MGTRRRRSTTGRRSERHGAIPGPAFGTYWAIGAPQSGKTTFALHRARHDATSRGVPLLALDAVGAHNFARIPRAATLKRLAERVWTEHQWTSFSPNDEREAETVFRMVLSGRDVALLVDEAHYWLSVNSRASTLLRLLRATQHTRANVFLTTQYLGTDVPQSAFACATELWVFRTYAPRSLEILRREYGIDPATVRTLPLGGYVKVRTAF